MKNQKVTFLTQAAMIAAIYVVLTVVFAPFGFGEVQVRVAESLTILPFFTPAAIPGLFIGCLIGNILGGAIIPDIIFGSLATLIAACFTYTLRKKSSFLAPNSIHDAYGRNWRNTFLRCTWNDCTKSTFQIRICYL